MEKPKLLISDANNNVYDVPFLEAVGMKAGNFFRLKSSDLVKLPEDSELFMLPGRISVGYEPLTGRFVDVSKNPLSESGEECFPVAAFLAPGYTGTFTAAYKEKKASGMLPLFSYSAVAYYKGGFYAAGVLVDREERQKLSGMDMKKIQRNVKEFRKLLPENRLARHLETCALVYGCPAGKNFFLKRYEGPLPTSPECNSRCIGCISCQEDEACPVTQPRIKFRPTPTEIAEVAIFHIKSAKDPVVSFGQGCEGEPLLGGKILVEAVRLIRRTTSKGIINLNTNASRPEIVAELFDAGLNSMRVSMNSVREKYYTLYYRPRGYSYRDVLRSIRNAKERNGFVSINYLVMPGFTDSEKEADALMAFVDKNKIDMIQWRNLNYDPAEHVKRMNMSRADGQALGMRELIRKVHKKFPRLMKGYFNPSRRRIKRFSA